MSDSQYYCGIDVCREDDRQTINFVIVSRYNKGLKACYEIEEVTSHTFLSNEIAEGKGKKFHELLEELIKRYEDVKIWVNKEDLDRVEELKKIGWIQ